MGPENPKNLSEQACKAYAENNFQSAADLFAQCAAAFRDSGDELSAAEAANNLSVALLKGGDSQGALDAADGTDQIFQKANDTRRQAMALSNQAAALEGLKKDGEALALYEQANEILKASGDQELRRYILEAISAIQLRTGRQLEAMASMQAALDNKKTLSAKDHILKRLLNQVFSLLRR